MISTHLCEGFDSEQAISERCKLLVRACELGGELLACACELLARACELSLQSAHSFFERSAVAEIGKRLAGVALQQRRWRTDQRGGNREERQRKRDRIEERERESGEEKETEREREKERKRERERERIGKRESESEKTERKRESEREREN
jgi:signal transduction histidine kinase